MFQNYKNIIHVPFTGYDLECKNPYDFNKKNHSFRPININTYVTNPYGINE